jgi:hypothetical protein
MMAATISPSVIFSVEQEVQKSIYTASQGQTEEGLGEKQIKTQQAGHKG